jgi:SAM-dependent methyltransferase
MTNRRVAPRLWDTDWLQLRPLARMLGEQARAHLPPGALVVDYGCGDMPYAALLRGLGLDYRPADINADAEAKGKLAISPEGRVPLGDGAAAAVLSVQVLEHVADLDAYCAEICRLLAPDGTLLLSTHGSWLYHPHPTDFRRWTRTGLVLDLESRGLVVEEIFAIVGPLATTTMLRLTGFAYTLRKLPLLGPLIAGALAVVMNLRGVLEDAITPAQMRLDNACVYLVRARKA